MEQKYTQTVILGIGISVGGNQRICRSEAGSHGPSLSAVDPWIAPLSGTSCVRELTDSDQRCCD